ADSFDLRLQTLHLHHRALTADRHRQRDQPHQYGEQDDSNAVVRHKMMKQLQQAQEWQSYYPPKAQIDGLAQRGIGRFKNIELLRPYVNSTSDPGSPIEKHPRVSFIADIVHHEPSVARTLRNEGSQKIAITKPGPGYRTTQRLEAFL